MDEKISKEHSRRVMVLLESLTGGKIDKKQILKYYKSMREETKKDRREALIEALGRLMIDMLLISEKEYRVENKKVVSNEFGDVYRVAIFSYLNAKPVEFIVQFYKVVPKLDEEYYKYIIYLVDSHGNKKVLEDSEEAFNYDEFSGTFESLDDAIEFALEYSLNYKMVDYAIEKSRHSISAGLFW